MYTIDLSTLQSYITQNINSLLYLNNWSLKTLSEKSDIPYDSLKKLVYGKINNPSLKSIIKLANAFNCPIDSILNPNIQKYDYDKLFSNFKIETLPERAITLLKEIANFELYLSQQNASNDSKLIPVLIPTGHMCDAMIFDSIYTESVDISGYQKEFDDNIMCGIKITSKNFHPTYLQGDILLIARDRHPAYGEIGIFVSKNKVYLRKYIYGDPSILVPVNGVGKNIVIEDMCDWYIFGRVLTVLRTIP